MSAFNTVETDYTLTCADGLGNFIVNANLQVNGNIQYSGTSTVTAPFVLVAANNTGAVTEMGLLAQTGSNTYSAIRFNSVVNAWQLSPSVNAVGNAVTPYANIATINDITYGNANVAAYLPTYTGNISGNVITGNLFVGNGGQLTNIVANVNQISNGTSNVSIPVANGNVEINTTGYLPWIFDTTGVISLTPSGVLNYGPTTSQLSDQYWVAAPEAAVSLVSNENEQFVSVDKNGIAIQTNAAASLNEWYFDKEGNLTLPANGNIYYSNGNLYTTYNDSNVASFLPTYTGNISAGNVLADGYYYANGTPVSATSIVTGDQQITPDGVSLVYTLNQTVSGENNILVMLNGVVQYPLTSYSTGVGNTITFATPPQSTDLIDIRFLGQGPANYGNSDVASYLLTNTGNIQANNVSILSLFQSPLRTVASTDPGNPGQICWDGNYIYVCVGTNTWSRVQLTAGPF